MSDDRVITHISDNGTATVTLANTARHNAFDDAMIAELHGAFERLGNDESVRVVVLAAEGKSFSAGADLNWMKRIADYSYDDNLVDARALAALLNCLNRLPRPTIARVQGVAFGGAVGLVSCCDMAIGSTRSSFCLSEVKIGLVPATIAPYVVRAIGERAARRYFQTAEHFDAETAQALGLLSTIVAEEDLDRAVEDLSATLRANGPMALQAAKELIAEVAGQPIDDALIEATSLRIACIRVSEEGQEGLGAFLEKRSPNWTRH